MKRYALLIEASEATGQAKIPGCVRDVERLESWLRGISGGAWNSNEIKVMHNPKASDIALIKPMLDDVDFAFVSFSGHGYISEDSSGRRTQKVTAGNGIDIDFNSLKPRADKAIMLCDACRGVHRESEEPFRVKAFEQYEKRASVGFTREQYREAFEWAVGKAVTGCYMMYACSVNESAGESALNGGLFTDGLLKQASDWFEERRTKSEYLYISGAFESAKKAILAEFSDQTPVGSPSNRSGGGNDLPFSICLA